MEKKVYEPNQVANAFSHSKIEQKWPSSVGTSEGKQATEGQAVYNHASIETKWQEKWLKDNTYSPDLDKASRPFYNLMMFPYPSAEGLHVGNMYAFTGADIYARFNRMQQKDVFEPIGLDGFGIHSENYALKIGKHPMDQAKVSEANFYRQLKAIGNSFDWTRTLATYDPEYYKWTQWIFTEMFKAGLAVRKRAPVNFCPSCKTVLSDEQVIDGKCERCGSIVEKRDLEQWFFKITNYAERLLNNIPSLDWAEKVKVAQKNWIGKSEGARISFPIKLDYNFVLLHGFTGNPEADFHPWLRDELEKRGYQVQSPALPNTENPTEEEQVDYVLKNVRMNEKTVVLGHSLGAVVAMKVIERLKTKIAGLVLAAGFIEPKFNDHTRPFETTFNWNFKFDAIRENAGFIKVLSSKKDSAVPFEQGKVLSSKLGAELVEFESEEDHITGKKEPVLLKSMTSGVEVFTTRPDTLYGATFLVLSPEHPVVKQLLEEKSIPEFEAVEKYVNEAKKKTEQERLSEGKEKTGVFCGKYAVNPVNGEEIPVWIADYVLMGYGTGAIMAVPAHDARDFEFARKFDLPIKQVIISAEKYQVASGKYQGKEKILNTKYLIHDTNLDEAYTGPGVLINSDKWNGLKVPEEMGKVVESLGERGVGESETTFHLRDWLISRQRYWGPPIPMIFCEKCEKEGKSWFTKNNKADVDSKEMAGWYPVEMSQLPVELPYIEDYKPLGTPLRQGFEGRAGSNEMVKGPLDNHPEFYETTCPACGGKARRETDVSDTFLDSSWYFFRYLATEVEDSAFSLTRNKKWLPVNVYIGGAEHSVLHLLYARFVTMVFKDLGYIDFEEPFSRFFAHGLIIKDGAKMSKSKGNVVVPDEYIKKYGADTLRLYLMFLGPFKDGGDFSDSGIEGSYRFVKRIWNLFMNNLELTDKDDKQTLKMINKTIKEVTQDIEDFSYNTAIARLMEMYNFVSGKDKPSMSRETALSYLKLLAPFTPHMAEEIYASLFTEDEKVQKSIHLEDWPQYLDKHLVESEVTVVVQVNGKRRGELKVRVADKDNQKLVDEQARAVSANYLKNEKIKKVVFVPGKIINFVV